MDHEPAVITRFFRKMGSGCSQPFLAEADDGNVYVVKYAHEGCANFLFNESLGSNLYGMFGLVCPAWKPLILTDGFLASNSDCWFVSQSQSGRVRTCPSAGLCFGSLFIGGEESETYQILPGSWVKRIFKPLDFWRAWFLDICAEHYDTRQALFQKRDDHLIQTWFIDHGFMFGGPDHNHWRKPMAPRYMDARVYGPTPVKKLSKWVEVAQSLGQDCYWNLLDSIPCEWKTLHAMSAFVRFLARITDRNFGAAVLERMNVINEVFLKHHSEVSQDDLGFHLYGRFFPSEIESDACEVKPDTLWVDELQKKYK